MVTATSLPRDVRRAAWQERFSGLTTGLAPGYVQANLAVLPAGHAEDFVAFCKANAQACPVLAVSEPGNPRMPELGEDIDIRTDVPSYWVYRDGQRTEAVKDISALWRDDHVAVAIGCWFSMEEALKRAGVRQRHIELGIQGPLFRTTRETVRVGRFGGPLVVSMRPFAANAIDTVGQVTSRFSRVHGAPLHVGDPAALGIADIAKPDFGEVLMPLPGEVPMFWGCGLTALAALEQSGIPLFMTHAAGAMLVTDLRNDDLED
ncbi:MAG: putative hydro-lyase [Pseudolabrys sp.]